MSKTKLERCYMLKSSAEVDELEMKIRTSTRLTIDAVAGILCDNQSMSTLARIRFEPIGRDPLDHARALNFAEQVNQTFTYLTTLRGVKYLLEHHPDAAPYRVNLGTLPGHDIVSIDNTIIAECFAATTPNSNNKLTKDVKRLGLSTARFKYVFYYSPIVYDGMPMRENVCIVRVSIRD